jgi:hypothetical protein
MYNKDDVKDEIEIEDIYSLLDYFQADPQMYSDHIESKTICHGGDSMKLYYYAEQKLFHCYTHCGDSFDVFELVQRARHIDDLNQAIMFVVDFFGLQGRVSIEHPKENESEDWKIFAAYEKINGLEYEKGNKVSLPIVDQDILKYYPQPVILPWIEDNINPDICDFMGIRYDPVGGNILIPHRNTDGDIIGIRQRTLIKDQEKYGKYRPWRRGRQLYNHPLGFNLYGFYEAKSNIEKTKMAIVVESEKSVLQSMSYLGTANNIAVAVCGSSLSKYQFSMLLDAGVNEVVIGFDKDFEELGSEEYFEVIEKLEKLYSKYNTYANISFLFDAENDTLGYKNSPFDNGKNAFLKLWRNRIYL